MEKKLKRVQRGAGFGFVVLKILRILLIVCAVLMIGSLIFLALYNENNLPLENIQDGLLTLDFSQFGISGIPQIGSLIEDGVLKVELKDLKLVLMMAVGAGLLVLVAAYVLLLVAGNLFKHIKKEDTPFTAGNVRRLRLLGTLYIVFWVCGMVLSYFVGSEVIRRLTLPTDRVSISLNLMSLVIALIFFFLARVFSFGKAQSDALAAAAPAPVAEPVPVAEPAPAPVYVAPQQPVYQAPVVTPEPATPAQEPLAAPEAVPAAESVPVAEAVEEPTEEIKLPEE